jgi:hypothetical protein
LGRSVNTICLVVRLARTERQIWAILSDIGGILHRNFSNLAYIFKDLLDPNDRHWPA